MKKTQRFKIQSYTNPSGSIAYRVTGTRVDGHRIRRNFKDAADAELYRQKLENEALNLNVQFRLLQTSLTEHQLRQAEAVFRVGWTVDLETAVRFYAAHHPAGRPCPTVEECVSEFLEDSRSKGLRTRTIRDYRNRTQPLVDSMGDHPLNTITGRQLTKLIRSRGGSHYAQNGLRRVMSALFNWAIKQDYILTSPINKVDVAKGEAPEPMILPIDDVMRVLAASAYYDSGCTLPLLAVALFCGLRPEECSRLSWSAFDFKRRTLTLTAKIAKKRSRRIIKLSDAALAFLEPHRDKKLSWSRWDKAFREVRRIAGFVDNVRSKARMNDTTKRPWCGDILRKTAISYWLGKHKDIAAAATWAGNSPDVIHDHYRDLVSDADAEDYWNLTPEVVEAWAKANAIDFNATQLT